MKREEFMRLLRYTGDYASTNTIRSFREDITPYGFESYIADFFAREEFGFTAFVCGGMDDRGIDVKGKRIESDGSATYIAIQCKRWSANHIHQHDIAEFYGNVVDLKKHGRVVGIYATTTWLTKNAWRFFEDHEMEFCIIDYRRLLELDAEFPLADWINERMKLAEDERLYYISEYYLRSMERKLAHFQGKVRTLVQTRQALNILKNAKQLTLPIQEMRFAEAFEGVLA